MITISEFVKALKLGKTINVINEDAKLLIDYITEFEPDLKVKQTVMGNYTFINKK